MRVKCRKWCKYILADRTMVVINTEQIQNKSGNIQESSFINDLFKKIHSRCTLPRVKFYTNVSLLTFWKLSCHLTVEILSSDSCHIVIWKLLTSSDSCHIFILTVVIFSFWQLSYFRFDSCHIFFLTVVIWHCHTADVSGY